LNINKTLALAIGFCESFFIGLRSTSIVYFTGEELLFKNKVAEGAD